MRRQVGSKGGWKVFYGDGKDRCREMQAVQ